MSTPRTDAWKKANQCDHWPEAGTSPFTLCRQLELELNAREEDLRLAAGELKVPMPEAGTDMARLLTANILLRHQRDEARAALKQSCDAEARLVNEAVHLIFQRDELLAALEAYRGQVANDGKSGYAEAAIAAVKGGKQ